MCQCITKGFGCRSVLIPAGCAVMVHRLCTNMNTLFSYYWVRNPELWLKNGPEANAKPQRERSHFPGYHGNLPAPRYSIIPEHRDISPSDVKETSEQDHRPRDTHREAEGEAETFHAFQPFVHTLNTTPKILSSIWYSNQDSAACLSQFSCT